jgi:hypothetical protein
MNYKEQSFWGRESNPTDYLREISDIVSDRVPQPD